MKHFDETGAVVAGNLATRKLEIPLRLTAVIWISKFLSLSNYHFLKENRSVFVDKRFCMTLNLLVIKNLIVTT